MARLEVERVDLPIEIRASADGSVTVCVLWGEPRQEYKLISVGPTERSWYTPDLSFTTPPFLDPLWRWLEASNGGLPARFGDRMTIPRIVLRIDDPALAALDWEQAIGGQYFGHARPLPFVRASSVPPRAANLPLSFPLRGLQIGPSADYSASQHWQQMFGHFGADGWGHSVIAEECAAGALGGTHTYRDWPTVDAVHRGFCGPRPRSRSRGSNRHPGKHREPRMAEPHRRHQPDAAHLAACRQLRGNIRTAAPRRGNRRPRRARCAGGRAPPPSATRFLREFSERILHDDPLDVAFGAAKQAEGDSPAMHTLVAGCGREDLLRVSNIGVKLMALNERLSARPGVSREWIDLRDTSQRLGAGPMNFQTLSNELQLVAGEWSGYTFSDHESGGFIPLASRVRGLRAATGITAPVTRDLSPTAPRYVNSSLWIEEDDSQLSKLIQRGARLTLGETVYLEVVIGPEDTSVRVVGGAALLEEVFKWTPDMAGVWVQIGVTGLDFEVLGDPVQELWLPRQGVTEPIYFALVPQRAGVARLRFSLYFGEDVVQSFRLAALTVSPGQDGPAGDDARGLLAQALALDVDLVGQEGYLARLEYSLGNSIDGIPERRGRKVSIVANHNDDEPVITVKAPNFFKVRTSGNLTNRVKAVRKCLAEVSVHAINVPLEKRPYAFGLDNRGDIPTLKNALRRLAFEGTELYGEILTQAARDTLKELLASPQIIHVAHVLLEDVIPWAVVYDRHYDAGCKSDANGAAVDQEVCLAPLPAAVGGDGARQCGVSPTCELHAARLKQRRERGQNGVLPETVVCPLHFWGFRHVVEVPPQQVKAGDTGHEVRNRIGVGAVVNLLAAYNATLDPTKTPPEPTHVDELDSVLPQRTPPAGAWIAKLSERDRILNALKQPDLDVIYFYCHARGGREHPEIDPPVLEIEAAAEPMQGWITPSNLNSPVQWTHHPLVFLNGCGTAGFSPDALSPFITKLVEDRGAAGVVGTEVSVREALAREFACHFLTAFLADKDAGQALLEARRKLLDKRNPLGLIYTLYAPADLQLERPSGSAKAAP